MHKIFAKNLSHLSIFGISREKLVETVNYHLLKDTLQSVPDGSLSILYVCVELLYWFFHDVSLGGSFVILFLCV